MGLTKGMDGAGEGLLFDERELRPLEQAAFQLRGERQLKAVESHPWDLAFKPGLRLQAQLAAAAARGKPTDLPTIGDALETMRLIQAIFEGRAWGGSGLAS